MVFAPDFWAIFAMTAASVAVVVGGAILFASRRHKPQLQRCTSLASALQAARPLLETHVGMKQNCINAVLFFKAGDVPTRNEMVDAMRTLAHKFARLRSRPCFKKGARTCEWQPLEDLEPVIQRAVLEDRVVVKEGENIEQAILQRVEYYKAQMVSGQDDQGRDMPYWRVIVLHPGAVLVRIDHSIGDGLALVTLLRDVGRNAKDGSQLELKDLSPLLRHFEQMGDRTIVWRPLQLLWLPNLWRATNLLRQTFALPKEPANPLRPLPQHCREVCPVEHVGTVYLPTLSLSFFKKLAKAAGPATTLNDIFLLCLLDAIRRYFALVDVENTPEVRLLLPISNPLPTRLYGDEYEGLCNRMTPVVVPLNLSSKVEATPRHALEEIQMFLSKVKQSHAPLLMTTINTILDPFLSLEQLAEGSRPVFERVSCIYSNVPGPTQAISLAGHKIEKIQTILPHAVSIFQILSYNNQVHCNLTLDTRSAPRPELFRESWLESIRHLAFTWGLSDNWRTEMDPDEWGGPNLVYTLNEGRH